MTLSYIQTDFDIQLIVRILAKTVPGPLVPRMPTACIDWIGFVRKARGDRAPCEAHGRLWVQGRMYYAHRAIWEAHNGPLEKRWVVKHECDRGICLNIEHLHPGSIGSNLKEAYDRGRRKSHPLPNLIAPAV